MSEPVLKLDHIAREFTQGGKTLSVLRDFNLEIREGEIVALVGPSGSGKTTLLQVAGLLASPTRGSVLLGGRDMTKAGDAERTSARRQHIGFVYQFHHLLPEFSALENVMMPQIIAAASKAAARRKAESLLEGLGLKERLHHRPGALSGGEQQRVAIARALANDPKLLLADEPTGNLDPATAQEVFALLLKQAKERRLAALIATHNLELAARMDRRIALAGAARSA